MQNFWALEAKPQTPVPLAAAYPPKQPPPIANFWLHACQGHKKNPRPRTALSRTDPLEAKDTVASVLQKKKVFKNFF